MLGTPSYTRRPCWLAADNAAPCVVTPKSPLVQLRKRKIASQMRRGSFTAQFTPMLRGKIAGAAIASHHIRV